MTDKNTILSGHFLKFTAASIALIAVSACSVPMKSYPPMHNNYPIQIAESVERLELYARPDGLSLSARDEAAVYDFIRNYSQFGDGPIYMNVPSNPNLKMGISQTQGLIAESLSSVGLSTAQMKTGQYQSAQAMAPVIISYHRLKALPQDCSNLGNLAYAYNNQGYEGFGCAYNANLAAMIQDPRQLLEPHPMAPPEVKRRTAIYDKYLNGENPASEQPNRQEISAGSN